MTPDALSFLKGDSVMAEVIRRHQWAASPLGPIEDWPDTLKTTVALMLGSGFPQAIVWGPLLLTLYNDAFIPILGEKPAALGRSFGEIWREAWDEIEPIAQAAFAGRATYIENFPLVVERGRGAEQAYFTFSYSPIRNGQGEVVGFLDTVTETTATVVATTRLGFLDQLGRALSNAESSDAIMGTTTRMLAEHLTLSNCAYADMDADEDGFTIRGDWAAPGSPNITGHYSLADFGKLAVRNLSAGEPLIINDNKRELAPEEAATFQSIGIAATICMPLVKAGRLTALMAIHDREPRIWSDYELALITEVSERSWAHIERVRSAAELRASAAALADLNATLEQRVAEAVAERSRAEETLRHAQKLDAIGQLTGGVAHDFNNLLTVIRSSADLLRRHDLDEVRRRRYLDAISETADRAAKLTSHLLAFSRRQALSPKVFDVCGRVTAVSEMLRSVLGSRIELEVRPPACPAHVEADPAEFETALLNMVINARDAMQGEGRLTVEVFEVDHLPPIRGHAPAAGPFVAVQVADTGPGIAPETMERIFEPFFTTKEVGRGTGLGLSQVFGFAKQSGGEIEVVSPAGAGAAFTLYLPRVEAQAEAERPREARPNLQGKGRVLMVEDNAQVGEFATQLLDDLGYRAELAPNAGVALEKLASDSGFDVVVSDVVMPGMNGIELGRRIRAQWPQMQILLTSGYSHVLAEDTRHGFELLRKPYSVEELSSAIRRVLRRSPAPASDGAAAESRS
jgi:signal transduction histidine kinase/CheY-like chemotaxis protein